MNNFKKGDHLVSQRFGYTHHGLCVGKNKVIHYLAEGVVLTSLAAFSDGEDVWGAEHMLDIYNRTEAVDRAYSRLGDDNYNVIFNNCEHFVNWCITGLHKSSQVNNVLMLGYASKLALDKVISPSAVEKMSTVGAPAAMARTICSTAAIGTGAKVATGGVVGATVGLATATAGTGLATTAGFVATGAAATLAAPVVVGVAVGGLLSATVCWLFDW